MLVATGTTTILPPGSVLALAAALASLTELSFVWSLKVVSACLYIQRLWYRACVACIM
jgi:hypothetical protein